MTNNHTRAQWARSALNRFADEVNSDEDDQTTMGDLIANMMHLADASGFDFKTALEAGASHYQAEIEEAKDPALHERDPIVDPPWPNTMRDLMEMQRAVRAMERLGKRVRHGLGPDDGFGLLLSATAHIFAEFYQDHTDVKERVIIEQAMKDEEAIFLRPMPTGETP